MSKARITAVSGDMASRRHKCEKCGVVFVCEDCTEALHNMRTEGRAQIVRNPKDRLGCDSLHSTAHRTYHPGYGRLWLCEACEACA